MKNQSKSTADELHHIAFGISVVFTTLFLIAATLTLVTQIFWNNNYGVKLIKVNPNSLNATTLKFPPHDVLLSLPSVDKENAPSTAFEKVQSLLSPKIQSYIIQSIYQNRSEDPMRSEAPIAIADTPNGDLDGNKEEEVGEPKIDAYFGFTGTRLDLLSQVQWKELLNRLTFPL